MTKTAILQAKQGIGDVIWHLPYVRAIAAASPDKAITFLSLPSSCADQILEGEPCVERVLYYENRGSELMRGWHFLKLVRTLRRHDFDTLWILDRSSRAALAALAAGIPHRIGMGLGRQSLFITNDGIDDDYIHQHPFEWLNALMTSMNIALPTTEPNLQLSSARIDQIEARFARHARPWLVLSFGATFPKDWPESSWMQFITLLRARLAGTVYLIGGAGQKARAARAVAETAGAPIVDACGLSIGDAAALIKSADLFVGPDSGPMNIAAAVGTPTFGLFGTSPVLTYSSYIHAIRPDDGRPQSDDGMMRISPDNVLAEAMAYLATPSPTTRSTRD